MEFKAHTCRISLLHEDIGRAGHKDHWMASQNLNGFTKLWPSINSKRTYCQHWPQATLKMKAMWLCSGRGEIVLTSPLFLWYFYQESQNTYRTGTRMKSIFPLSNKSQLSLMFSSTVSQKERVPPSGYNWQSDLFHMNPRGRTIFPPRFLLHFGRCFIHQLWRGTTVRWGLNNKSTNTKLPMA